MKFSAIFCIVFCVIIFSDVRVLADGPGAHWAARPDGHAPIGVMGDHTHRAGEWMVSYRFMRMEMEDHRTGSKKVSDAEVLNDFMIAPMSMAMDMHMIGVMYAVNDSLTLMGMVPYISKSMDHRTRAGARFNTKSQGIGDLKFTGLYRLLDSGNQHVHLNVGISVPTGSIDEKDTTPAGPGQKLPYPMQIGSGAVDLIPGITYLGQSQHWSWGSQALATIRFYDNANDYHLGDEYKLNLWGSYKWAEWISTSLRVETTIWGDVKGADPDLNANVVPTADPELRGGKRIDLLFGVNLYAFTGPLEEHRIAFEAGFPLYQYLNGPQLGIDFQSTVGWQIAF